MKQDCPFCNASLDIPDELVGQEVTCAACNESFFADGPNPPTPTPPPSNPPRFAPPKGSGAPFPTPPFRKFTHVEVDDREIRSELGGQVWRATAAILLGTVSLVLWPLTGSEICAILACALLVAGMALSVCCIIRWASFALACLKTIAVNSSVPVPVVFAEDPRKMRSGTKTMR